MNVLHQVKKKKPVRSAKWVPSVSDDNEKKEKDYTTTILLLFLVLVVNFDLYHLYKNSNPLPLLHTVSYVPMMFLGIFFNGLRRYRDVFDLVSCSLLFILNMGYFYFLYEGWGALLFFFFVNVGPTASFCEISINNIKKNNENKKRQ